MRLFYFDRAPNYGDLLNPWLWPHFLGDRLQPESDTLFLGLGTILKTDLPDAKRYVVLGAGGGYGPFPTLDARWRVYAVRGPLSAEALGVAPEKSAIDPAYLLRDLPLPTSARSQFRIGFMPHFWTKLRVPWEEICESARVHYIDPSSSVDNVLAQLRGCDAVIGEAMHACITADALRIPWLPVKIGGDFLDFKWRDWLGSIALDARLQPLQATRPIIEEKPAEISLRRAFRRTINGIAYAVQARSLTADLRRLASTLEKRPSAGYLSADTRVESGLDRLKRALEEVRRNES